VTAFVTAGAGFLLAVLWFDLMFDVQALRAPGGEVGEEELASIGAYYARVTTAARPMDRLIVVVMVGVLAALVVQAPRWEAWVSLVLAGGAIGLAGVRTVPAAVRLGAGTDPLQTRRRMARRIGREHVVCFALIAAVLVVQLGFAR
jgi:hypothetical protein